MARISRAALALFIMEISLEELGALVGNFFWPFIRIAALFMVAPIFGARTVPVRIRIILAVVMTLVLQSSLQSTEAIEPLSSNGILVILQQLAIGIVMGLILQIMFAALVMAGQLMATTMGLGFASMVDPQNGVQVTMLGQFYLIISTLFFLAIDGHLIVLQLLLDSFTVLPINGAEFPIQIFWELGWFVSQMFIAAVLISLPVLIGVLLVNLGFGVMTRAAPQLNIFAVGFPTTMLAGFILMFLSLPVLFPLMESLFSNSFVFLRLLVN